MVTPPGHIELEYQLWKASADIIKILGAILSVYSIYPVHFAVDSIAV